MIRALLSRLSIRVIAPLMLVLPMLAASGVLIAMGSLQGRAAVERLASQQLAQIHDQIGQHVDALVSQPARVDQANIALLDHGRLDPDAIRTWRPIFIEQFRAFESLSAVTWGAEDGSCTWIARYAGDDEHLYYAIKDAQTGEEIVEYHVDADGRVHDEPAGSFVYDPRTRPWYTAPKEAGRPAWSAPFLWVGGADEEQATLGIAYGWPWYDDTGALVGIMDADLSLQDISRYLAGLEIGRTGRAYLVDSDGLILASSTNAALVDEQGARRHAAASDADWIRQSAEALSAAFGDVGAVDSEHEDVIDVGGADEWLRASPFTHETGLDWVIVTLVPESDFMAEISAGRRRSAMFTAGVTIAVLALGIGLATLFVRPIVELSRHVGHLGDGDLDREVHLPYATELVRLSDDINRMTLDLRDRMALRRSLAMAMEVQQGLLPSETPTIRGLDIYGHSTYCDETGGDYYDYLDIADLENDSTALVVGDVMGHGIAAAMLMATARGILRSRSTQSGTLGEVLGHLNHLLVEVTGGSRFMTMVIVIIDATNGALRLSSAGHDPPFIYNPETDAFIELESGGLPLGILAEEEYPETEEVPLPVGSIVLSSTDGVWEAQNEADEQFGKERVCDYIRANSHLSARDLAKGLQDAVQEFCGEARQLDDITFVVVKRVDSA